MTEGGGLWDSENPVVSIAGALPDSEAVLAGAIREAGLSDQPYEIVWVSAPDGLPRNWTARRDRRTLALVQPDDERDHLQVWRLLSAGADDVMTWNGHSTIEHVLAKLQRWRRVDEVIACPGIDHLVVGASRSFRAALVEVIELAMFGTNPILLTGETGTGKELVARLVHRVSPHAAGGSFVVLDCTTIVATLAGSELFGHVRGAFTGAEQARNGAIAAADGGTLFLDEIGELPLDLQAQLLRVLQEHTYKRVGGDVWLKSNFRLVSATNRDLLREQRKRRFRSDLYHRIASGVVHLPPLRERAEDIPLLFSHFLKQALQREVRVEPSVLAMLNEQTFPGNLRQLMQLALAVAARHSGDGPITPGDIPASLRPRSRDHATTYNPAAANAALREAVAYSLRSGMSLAELKQSVGDLAVEVALSHSDGNVHRASALLGVSDRAVQMRRRGQSVTPTSAAIPSPRRAR